mgnify:CR=1 FL=1
MDRYKGKVIVVTGAGGGIGRASAIRFASEGGSVLAVDFQGEALSETVQTVKDAGGDIHGVQSDVGEAEQVQQYLEPLLLMPLRNALAESCHCKLADTDQHLTQGPVKRTYFQWSGSFV